MPTNPTNTKPANAVVQSGHTEQDAFLLGISEAHSCFGMTYDGDSSSPRSLAYDYGRNVGEAIADLGDAQLPAKWREQILTACNTHARLVEALHNTERTLSALASSELTIDEDRNRTPLRLAQRNDVWRAIESARALLSEIGGGK